jgi:hypothetical protein
MFRLLINGVEVRAYACLLQAMSALKFADTRLSAIIYNSLGQPVANN